MAEEIKVEGLADLRVAVEELRQDLRRRVIIGALKDAAKPIVRAAKGAAPVKTGLVRSSIGSATSKVFKGQSGVLGVYVRVRKVKGRRIKGTRVRVVIAQNDPYYWKFQELGTRRGVRARHFLQTAGQSNLNQALEIFKTKLAERIAKANART